MLNSYVKKPDSNPVRDDIPTNTPNPNESASEYPYAQAKETMPGNLPGNVSTLVGRLPVATNAMDEYNRKFDDGGY